MKQASFIGGEALSVIKRCQGVIAWTGKKVCLKKILPVSGWYRFDRRDKKSLAFHLRQIGKKYHEMLWQIYETMFVSLYFKKKRRMWGVDF